jgi:prevent-host-death family protein
MNEKNISLTELRKNFEDVLTQVEEGTSFVITRYRKAVAVLVPFVEAPGSFSVSNPTPVESVLEEEEELSEDSEKGVVAATADISSFE